MRAAQSSRPLTESRSGLNTYPEVQLHISADKRNISFEIGVGG